MLEKKLQLHYMDTESSVIGINPKDIIKDLQNHADLIDFGNLNENHELFSNKNKKVVGKFKLKLLKTFG